MCYIEVILFFKFQISNPNKIQFLNNWQFTTKKNHFSVMFSFLNYKVIEDNKKNVNPNEVSFWKLTVDYQNNIRFHVKKKKVKFKRNTVFENWQFPTKQKKTSLNSWDHI